MTYLLLALALAVVLFVAPGAQPGDVRYGCSAPGGGGGAPASPYPSGEVLSARVLDEGLASGITSNREIVVREQKEWERLYSEHAPGKLLPAVDFNKEMVIGLVLARNTGGYQVRLDNVVVAPRQIVVTYTESVPGPDQIVTQVLTQPYAFIAVPRREGPVLFIGQKVEPPRLKR